MCNLTSRTGTTRLTVGEKMRASSPSAERRTKDAQETCPNAERSYDRQAYRNRLAAAFGAVVGPEMGMVYGTFKVKAT